jgi:hypothetical protein
MRVQYSASDVQFRSKEPKDDTPLTEGGQRGDVLRQLKNMVDAEAIHLSKNREIAASNFGPVSDQGAEQATRTSSVGPTATDAWATPAHPLTTAADVKQQPRGGGAAAGWEFQSSAVDVGVRLAVWDHPESGIDAWYVNRIVGCLGPMRHQLLVEDPRCQRAHTPEGLREVDLDRLTYVYLDGPEQPPEQQEIHGVVLPFRRPSLCFVWDIAMAAYRSQPSSQCGPRPGRDDRYRWQWDAAAARWRRTWRSGDASHVGGGLSTAGV